jgi:hypothetical protein
MPSWPHLNTLRVLNLQDDPTCNYKITHANEEIKANETINHQHLQLITSEDRRESDKDERSKVISKQIKLN